MSLCFTDSIANLHFRDCSGCDKFRNSCVVASIMERSFMTRFCFVKNIYEDIPVPD